MMQTCAVCSLCAPRLVRMPARKKSVTLSKPLLAAAAIVVLLDASAAALPRRHDVGQLTLQELVESATTADLVSRRHTTRYWYAGYLEAASALSDAEISRIATFGAVLGQYDACHDSAVVQALNDTLNTEWSQAERETWLAIGRRHGDAAGWPPERLAHCLSAAGTKRDACLGPPNKGWRIGVPCADTARWWVSDDSRWDAREWPPLELRSRQVLGPVGNFEPRSVRANVGALLQQGSRPGQVPGACHRDAQPVRQQVGGAQPSL